MKLRIGDKVKFLNEVGEGIVARIKDAKTVFVEMEDGFEIPFLINQLVPVRTELILNEDTDNINLFENSKIEESIYFVLEPNHEMQELVSEYRLYLFNSSAFNVMYVYNIKDEDHYQSLKQGELGAYQKVELKKINANFLHEFTIHQIECIFFKNNFFHHQQPISQTMRIDKKIISNSRALVHQDFKYPVHAFLLKDKFELANTIVSQLNPTQIEHVKMIKEFKTEHKLSKAASKISEKEIDLHIEELVESPANMSSYEKLNIQLERVERELDEALLNFTKKVIFIHGVGNGRLKQEIIAILKQMDEVTFHDASFKEYGYGATQVNFK